MNMREKIARALLAKDYPDDVGGEMEDFWWDRHGARYLDMADAVLGALLEPTGGMIEAGTEADIPGGRYGEATFRDSSVFEDDVLVIWADMIRAAKEGK